MAGEHVPTDQTKAQVSALVGFGITTTEISQYLGISRPTLHKYYQFELDNGKVAANVKVAQSLFKQCMEGNTTSMIFWLKTRAGWRETSRHEVTGPDGAPLKLSQEITLDLTKLTVEEKKAVLKAVRKDEPDKS